MFASPSALLATSLLLAAAALAAALVVRVALQPHPLVYFLGWVERRTSPRRSIAFYAVSHGELLLLERLLPLLEEQMPETELLVIVPSSSVENVARERLRRVRIECLRPIVPWGMRRALARLAPDMLVIVEFARIPLWVRACKQLQVPVVVINGRLSEKNRAACRRWRWMYAPMLRRLELALVQTERDGVDFVEHGALAPAVAVAGALKYDAASYTRNTFATQRLARLAGIGPDEPVFVAGSTRKNEEAVVAAIYERLRVDCPQLRLIIVPRNRHRFAAVAGMLRRRGIAFQRRSELDAAGADPQARVLLVDTVGELAAWWGTATIGFVGASLNARGGQNMIEPAALGVATCFGPHTANFRDVVELLLSREAAVEVHSAAELEGFVRRCMTDRAYAETLGRRAQEACRDQTGAMQATCTRLSHLLTELALSDEPEGSIVKFPEPRSIGRKQRRAA